MMNIIGNSCVGGFIYKNELKLPFQNPFIWALIDFESMLYMATNFNSINFNRFKLVDTGNIKDGTWSFNLCIDNAITVQYVHYKFSATAIKPTVQGIDVYYNKIWEYIVEKYKARVARMCLCKTAPIFVFANWFNKPETALDANKLQRLNALKSNNIICAVDKLYPEFTYVKQTLRDHNIKIWNPGLAHKIYDEFLK